MGLENVNVVRCDLCKNLLEHDEYVYPWKSSDSDPASSFFCHRCDVVVSRLWRWGWLKDRTPLDGRWAVHVVLARGTMEKGDDAWEESTLGRWTGWSGPLDNYTDAQKDGDGD